MFRQQGFGPFGFGQHGYTTQTEAGGYDYQFVEEPPDSLKCLICLLVARDPQQHGGCGKLFCKSCIATHRAQRYDCPHCRQQLAAPLGGNITMFNDFKSDQEVKSLQIFCSNSCGWKGELRALEEHTNKVCENAEVPCPNACSDGKIMRKNLRTHLENRCPRRKLPCQECGQLIEYCQFTHHLMKTCPKRQYYCPKCNDIGQYEERTTTHLKVCPKVRLRCPKCTLPVFRCDITKHIESCTHEPVPCKYSEIGCTQRPLRRNLKNHEENVQLHLAIATEKVLELSKALSCTNRVTFKVTEFGSRKSNNESVLGPHIFTSRFGYKMCVEVDANGSYNGEGTHVSVYAYLMKGDNDDSLTWPFTGTVTVELLNQLEDKNHHKDTFTFPPDDDEVSGRVVTGERGEGWGETQFIPHTDLGYQPDKNCQYLKDDTLVFRVSAEAPDYKPWLECTP